MKIKFLSVALAVVLGTGYALTAFSQARPETLVKQRQAVMTLQGKYFYPLLNMVRGRIPYDANTAVRNAAFLDPLSKMPWDGFDPRTKDLKSGALPAVYTNTAKFKEDQDRLQAEVAKLVSVSKGSEAAIKAQIEAVDKACGSCHETFRERQ